ncbi:MAG: hypothetical protein ACK504_09175 [Bacteroidota bacterium]
MGLDKKLKNIQNLPLTFNGLKPMVMYALRTHVPVFPTKKHASVHVPRQQFYKPISKITNE